jgi:hypothetical protein
MNLSNTQIPITFDALVAFMYENERVFNEKFEKNNLEQILSKV